MTTRCHSGVTGSCHRGTPRQYVGTPPRPAEAAVLALQRTVGNRAVASVLGEVVVQRVNGKRKAPEATTFTSASQDFTYATGTAPAEVRWAGARPITVTGAVVPTEPVRPPTAVPLAYLQKDQGGTASERRLLGFDGG
ncbi:MAG TPA: hypothetical protein VHH34_14340, partial [Pseudonocardiaceae bacterium]|nr:hypothetical protein [Pseudonocardiaceae bacterium]